MLAISSRTSPGMKKDDFEAKMTEINAARIQAKNELNLAQTNWQNNQLSPLQQVGGLIGDGVDKLDRLTGGFISENWVQRTLGVKKSDYYRDQNTNYAYKKQEGKLKYLTDLQTNLPALYTKANNGVIPIKATPPVDSTGTGTATNASKDAKSIGSTSQTKNITINIDSFVKEFTPTHQSVNAMSTTELERWFTETFLRVTRSAEMTM